MFGTALARDTGKSKIFRKQAESIIFCRSLILDEKNWRAMFTGSCGNVKYSKIFDNCAIFSQFCACPARRAPPSSPRTLPRGAVARKQRTSLSAGRTPPCQRDPERLEGEVGPGAAQVLHDDHRRGCARPPPRRDGRGQIHVHQVGRRHSSVANWSRAAQILDFPLVPARSKRNTPIVQTQSRRRRPTPGMRAEREHWLAVHISIFFLRHV